MEASPARLPDGRVTVPPDVVRRAFGDEVVLLNLKTGEYHGLNRTAGHMLDLLEETGDATATAERVAREFALPIETIEEDVAELCAQLAERGLIAIG